MSVRLIWAQSVNGVIGQNGHLPWRLPEDLSHFSALTNNSVVIMGRGTWDSLPDAHRPLKNRHNIVLSRTCDYLADGVSVFSSLQDALVDVNCDAWVIGGQSVYEEAMPYAEQLYVTYVNVKVQGDAYAPVIDEKKWKMVTRAPKSQWNLSTHGLGHAFSIYNKVV